MLDKTKSIAIIILILALIVSVVSKCGDHAQVWIPKINTDSIIKSGRAHEREITALKGIAKGQDEQKARDIHHYHTIRRDSLIPCEDKLQACDTIIVHDSIHDVTQDRIIAKQDTVIMGWKLVHSVDSATVRELKKDLRKQKWKTRGVIALWLIREGLGVANKER